MAASGGVPAARGCSIEGGSCRVREEDVSAGLSATRGCSSMWCSIRPSICLWCRLSPGAFTQHWACTADEHADNLLYDSIYRTHTTVEGLPAEISLFASLSACLRDVLVSDARPTTQDCSAPAQHKLPVSPVRTPPLRARYSVSGISISSK